MTRLRIIEREQGGRTSVAGAYSRKGPPRVRISEFATKVFLPAGYPASVSPDYLRYQIFNALQAFCSSLAGLISSRALLEGFGVGNAEASATHALLLTVLQDCFSRLTTICAAYALGPLLTPEAKTFRLLADVCNDAAIVLDTLSPLFIASPGVRVGALCLSGALRALCGIAAGAKATLTVHFATPTQGTGDVGDLNAKDSSKETVLALLGMLVGSLIVPYLTTPWTTYSVLFTLVGLHLLLNYVGIRGVVLRTLNRQRLSIAWELYRESSNKKCASPAEVSARERIFELRPEIIRTGRCTIGSSLNAVLRSSRLEMPLTLIDDMKRERYVLWFDRISLSTRGDELPWGTHLHLHICLKEGHSPADQLKAWAHAVEVSRISEQQNSFPQAPAELILAAYRTVDVIFAGFLKGMRGVGWNTAEAALLSGAPRAVFVSIEPADLNTDSDEQEDFLEDRKER
ncbi:vitamin B6 photo-protection and homoeostasis-domain-containing protein [Mycena vitilis]|nr:vitamin B6 photo-protection and homoeostasis-domain-containing protein [Mycena vitilis]